MTHEFLAFVDEAGDPGLEKVWPLDAKNAASEWLVLGCFLARSTQLEELAIEHERIIDRLRARQTGEVHFRNLSSHRRMIAADMVGSITSRTFVLISNKRNMRKYRNQNAEKYPANAWFYNFCLKVLLERIVAGSRFYRRNGGKIKLILSERGGVRYRLSQAYHELIIKKSEEGKLFLPKGRLDGNIYSPDDTVVRQHSAEPGLQFADVLASAFFVGVEERVKPADPRYALAFKRTIHRRHGTYDDLGIKVLPWRFPPGLLSPSQAALFREYGLGPFAWRTT